MSRLTFVLFLPMLAIVGYGQQTPTDTNAPVVIKTETREVLVDTIVTDKHGTYLNDLKESDFRVWQDDKEQKIKSFSYSADPNSPAANQKHYLVLLFDNASMALQDQGRARIAATKFIETNASGNRYIAIAEFGGTLKIAQNFTQDAELLKKVANTMKFSSVSPNDAGQLASIGAPVLSPEAEFGVRTDLLALRSLAKSLATVPGRKSIVFLTSGFQITPELQSEVTAVISACNRANVAIYPIDVRGLTSGISVARVAPADAHSPRVTLAGLHWTGSGNAGQHQAHLVYVGQRAGGGGGPRGGGGGGGAPRAGGGPTGPRGGTGVPRPAGGFSNPNFGRGITPPRSILPPLGSGIASTQDILRQLADGTGGFVILNSNDLLGGMQRVSQEQNQYYVLGYEPPEGEDGSCHTIKVKVNRGGTLVRARSGYCSPKPLDFLAGKPIEKDLEKKVNGTQAGVTASMQAPFFYTSSNTARVDLAINMPANAIKFDKDKGKYKGEVNVLGIAYRQDGSVAARFSDAATLDFDEKKQVEDFAKGPYRYENQFDIASGSYTLKVAFSSGGESFGKLEMPLVIEPYDRKQFALSPVVLSSDMYKIDALTQGVDADLLEDKKPLIFQGVRFLPSGSDHFKKSQTVVLYCEVYDPLLVGDNAPKVALQFVVTDTKTGAQPLRAAIRDTSMAVQKGNPVMPLALKIPFDSLLPGQYRVELRAVDDAGHSTNVRTAQFSLE